jgi:hypothetical protein
MLALGLVGAVRSWRRREVLAFPLLTSAALVCMWALVDGNVGTAFRHRGEVVWAVLLLAVHGWTTLADRKFEAPASSVDRGETRVVAAARGD